MTVVNLPGYMETGTKTNKDLSKYKILSNCWICEGWTQIRFTYRKSEDEDPSANVFLHLEFENYTPEVMLFDAKC